MPDETVRRCAAELAKNFAEQDLSLSSSEEELTHTLEVELENIVEFARYEFLPHDRQAQRAMCNMPHNEHSFKDFGGSIYCHGCNSQFCHRHRIRYCPNCGRILP
jgi:hypothetical protein